MDFKITKHEFYGENGQPIKQLGKVERKEDIKWYSVNTHCPLEAFKTSIPWINEVQK